MHATLHTAIASDQTSRTVEVANMFFTSIVMGSGRMRLRRMVGRLAELAAYSARLTLDRHLIPAFYDFILVAPNRLVLVASSSLVFNQLSTLALYIEII